MADDEINALDLSLPDPTAPGHRVKNKSLWTFGRFSICCSAAAEGHRDYAIPAFVRDEVAMFGKIRHSERKNLERLLYSLLLMGAIMVEAILLSPLPLRRWFLTLFAVP